MKLWRIIASAWKFPRFLDEKSAEMHAEKKRIDTLIGAVRSLPAGASTDDVAKGFWK